MPDRAIFDMDDVLCRYDPGRRLADKRSNGEGAVIAKLRGPHFTSHEALQREVRALGLID